jgi:hypothetical protein
MARIEKLLNDADTSASGTMLSAYRDEALTTGKLYWGAIQPVVDRRPDEAALDIRWLVLVEEPLKQ